MKIISEQKIGMEEILEMIKSKRALLCDSVDTIVQPILDAVRVEGDSAICRYTQKFDGWAMTPETMRVTQEELEEAMDIIDPIVITDLKKCAENIRRFHDQTLVRKSRIVQSDGIRAWSVFRPLENVGLYVPGGSATYPSTVLMLAVPAQVAGVQNAFICTPASREGKCAPIVLVVADICGIKPENIFKIGGAQAIGAMAFGTQTVPKVCKIFGPGNGFVTEAKLLVQKYVPIDMPAGPSELAVIADEFQNPEWIAADLLSQLEHGPDSQTILITNNQKFAEAVMAELEKQSASLQRKEIIEKSMARSLIVVVKNWGEAISITNGYAPEHLEIVLKEKSEEDRLASLITNAGSVFLGKYSTEPLGDYATGPNHTLPTSGFAKSYSGLNASSFGRVMSIQRVSKKGCKKLADTVERLARMEGLDAHAEAVKKRQ
ncbi:MAG: histidinol dehydrogenase [Candidatus Gracilibacteria bacterium]